MRAREKQMPGRDWTEMKRNDNGNVGAKKRFYILGEKQAKVKRTEREGVIKRKDKKEKEG